MRTFTLILRSNFPQCYFVTSHKCTWEIIFNSKLKTFSFQSGIIDYKLQFDSFLLFKFFHFHDKSYESIHKYFIFLMRHNER